MLSKLLSSYSVIAVFTFGFKSYKQGKSNLSIYKVSNLRDYRFVTGDNSSKTNFESFKYGATINLKHNLLRAVVWPLESLM